jgi:hypothetical protein
MNNDSTGTALVIPFKALHRTGPNWGPQQLAALEKIDAWLRNPNAKQVFYLAGFAGVGKSYLGRIHFLLALGLEPVFEQVVQGLDKELAYEIEE